MAEDMVGQKGRKMEALPIKETLEILTKNKARLDE